jgi:hypothetical protein
MSDWRLPSRVSCRDELPANPLIHRVIASFLIKQAGVNRRQPGTGAVTLIQRFGSAANLNIHLTLPGARRRLSEPRGCALFYEVPISTSEELQALLVKIITRIMRLLTRQGFSSKSKA